MILVKSVRGDMMKKDLNFLKKKNEEEGDSEIVEKEK